MLAFGQTSVDTICCNCLVDHFGVAQSIDISRTTNGTLTSLSTGSNATDVVDVCPAGFSQLPILRTNADLCTGFAILQHCAQSRIVHGSPDAFPCAQHDDFTSSGDGQLAAALTKGSAVNQLRNISSAFYNNLAIAIQGSCCICIDSYILSNGQSLVCRNHISNTSDQINVIIDRCIISQSNGSARNNVRQDVIQFVEGAAIHRNILGIICANGDGRIAVGAYTTINKDSTTIHNKGIVDTVINKANTGLKSATVHNEGAVESSYAVVEGRIALNIQGAAIHNKGSAFHDINTIAGGNNFTAA